MNIELIKIPKIEDYRGNLGIIEKDTIPFAMKRVYYLFDIPSSAVRGGHAHKEQKAFLVALSGSFDVILDNGSIRHTVTLNKPDKGLLIENNTWREINNFSSGAVCLVISSGEFDENDYIRDYDEFLQYINQL
jgi:hypothetical protein